MTSSVSKEPPFYIVGLPESKEESVEAKTKFEHLSCELTKVFPTIEEIRAVVKSKKASKEHARYEVSVEVYTPRERHAFSESGYSLVTIFDLMEPKIKRLLSSKASRVTASRGRTQRKVAVRQ
jgi:hypothetical protein